MERIVKVMDEGDKGVGALDRIQPCNDKEARQRDWARRAVWTYPPSLFDGASWGVGGEGTKESGRLTAMPVKREATKHKSSSGAENRKDGADGKGRRKRKIKDKNGGRSRRNNPDVLFVCREIMQRRGIEAEAETLTELSDFIQSTSEWNNDDNTSEALGDKAVGARMIEGTTKCIAITKKDYGYLPFPKDWSDQLIDFWLMW